MNWRHRASCRDEDPELFFPTGTTKSALEQLSTAKSVCHRCPVTSECLAWALDTGQRNGVWGGLSEEERHRLRQHTSTLSTTDLTLPCRNYLPLDLTLRTAQP
ncbi:WhiB family transcriptional regulator [Saccharopolyspora sp. K220]|uniref:WhiB family transcriptional regulator n=1 Tax=Saccharopolyspora soli TaxID=2926618 RepID=UPI001F590123|nr:WhiB family transcriptional regulator [Saccharopolyspora soli]MCI2424380.1 WhiB family transcriptional regulator [Saccharopolyspora soli]